MCSDGASDESDPYIAERTLLTEANGSSDENVDENGTWDTDRASLARIYTTSDTISVFPRIVMQYPDCSCFTYFPRALKGAQMRTCAIGHKLLAALPAPLKAVGVTPKEYASSIATLNGLMERRGLCRPYFPPLSPWWPLTHSVISGAVQVIIYVWIRHDLQVLQEEDLAVVLGTLVLGWLVANVLVWTVFYLNRKSQQGRSLADIAAALEVFRRDVWAEVQPSYMLRNVNWRVRPTILAVLSVP